MRQSDLAEGHRPPGTVLSLVEQARHLPAPRPRSRALITQQRATAHALDGDAASFEQAIDLARGEAAAAVASDDAPWGQYCTPVYAAMQEATGWMQLGQAGKTVSASESQIGSVPAMDRVDAGLFRARQARVYQMSGLPDHAAHAALSVCEFIGVTGSWRARTELAQVRKKDRPPSGEHGGRQVRRDPRRWRPGGGRRQQPVIMRHLISAATAADAASQAAPVAVLPIGSFELADDYGLLLLPPVTVSCSHEHAAFPGTVSSSTVTLAAIVSDIRESLRGRGIGKLVLVNARGGNYVLSNVVQEPNVGGRRMTLFPGQDDWDRARQDAGCQARPARTCTRAN